jgi:hypothetical protein
VGIYGKMKYGAFIGCDCSGSGRERKGHRDRPKRRKHRVKLTSVPRRKGAEHVHPGQSALVFIPRKNSELGNAFGSSRVLDELGLPIDKEAFMRMLSYYEIRLQTERPSSASTKIDAAQLATAAHRRKS